MAKARLLYVMDPTCSQCRGFALVVEAPSRQAAADGVALHLAVGGPHAGHGAAFDPNTRGYILGHWQAVQQATGQPFRLDGVLPKDFVCDTGPACRALVTAHSLDEENTRPLMKAIQRAFYAKGRDVTQAAVLASLAEAMGVSHVESAAVFGSGEACDATAADFVWIQGLGTAGFPTLLAERNGQLALLTNDYQPLAELLPLLGRWLERGRHE